MAYDPNTDGQDGNTPQPTPTPGLPEAPVDPNALFNAVQSIYKNALGREGSADDINSWIGGTGRDLGKIQQGIYGSPEAASYAKTQSTPAAPAGGGDPTSFIRQWQDSHPADRANFLALTEALKNQFGVNRFDYGANGGLSNNEVDINGQKFKVMGAEDGPNAYWYRGGDDSGGGGRGMSGMPDFSSSFYRFFPQYTPQHYGASSFGTFPGARTVPYEPLLQGLDQNFLNSQLGTSPLEGELIRRRMQ